MTRVRAAWMALPAWRGEASYPNCDVGPISLVWRSYAVGNGRIRTPVDTVPIALACGQCLRQARTGYRLGGEPSVCRRCRAESPETPARSRTPFRRGTRHQGLQLRDVIPGRLAPSPESSGLIAASRAPQQGRVSGSPEPHPPACGRGPRRTSARKPASPDPTAGRRFTMDKRPCRSLRPSGPDDRRATAAEGHRDARR
jgi:hypothetical protein